MGFYTELTFNDIQLAEGCLPLLHDSATKILLDKDCPWSYMLNYVYVDCSDYRTLDLQLSKAMKKELTKLFGTSPVPWNKLGEVESRDSSEEEADDLWYTLQWYPYDGHSGKWYHVDGFVAWVSAFCTGGQLFELTQEDGGGLWGWEFNGGMFRQLELRPKGRWRKGGGKGAMN